MKVTKFNRLSELIANNTLVYVLGEHGTVVVGFGGSLGIVLCSEELARQIHVLGGSMKKNIWLMLTTIGLHDDHDCIN